MGDYPPTNYSPEGTLTYDSPLPGLANSSGRFELRAAGRGCCVLASLNLLYKYTCTYYKY